MKGEYVPLVITRNPYQFPQLIARQQKAKQIKQPIRDDTTVHCSKMGRALRKLALMETDKMARILSENKVRAWVEKKENGLKIEQVEDIMSVFLDERLRIRWTS